MLRPIGEAFVLLLPNVLQVGDSSGSLLETTGSFGNSGLMGGSEGLPECVLSEPSSMALVSEKGIVGAWCSWHQCGC